MLETPGIATKAATERGPAFATLLGRPWNGLGMKKTLAREWALPISEREQRTSLVGLGRPGLSVVLGRRRSFGR